MMKQTMTTMAALSILSIVGTASATDFQIVQNRSWMFPLSPGSQQLSFNKFDTFDGTRTLKEVCLKLTANVMANVTGENNSTIPSKEFTLNLISFVTAEVKLNPTRPALQTFVNLNQSEGPVFVEATDNNGMPNGMGDDFYDFGTISSTDMSIETLTEGLDRFEGAMGSILVNIEGAAGFSISGSTDATVTVDMLGAMGTATLIYKYVPSPGSAGLLAVAGLAAVRRRRK